MATHVCSRAYSSPFAGMFIGYEICVWVIDKNISPISVHEFLKYVSNALGELKLHPFNV